MPPTAAALEGRHSGQGGTSIRRMRRTALGPPAASAVLDRTPPSATPTRALARTARPWLRAAASSASISTRPAISSPAWRHSGLEIAGLVEMLADDAAARSHGRAVLARALVGVADGGVRSSTALAAGGPSAVRRMRRMLVPPW